jgi:hypothetical protein
LNLAWGTSTRPCGVNLGEGVDRIESGRQTEEAAGHAPGSINRRFPREGNPLTFLVDQRAAPPIPASLNHFGEAQHGLFVRENPTAPAKSILTPDLPDEEPKLA